LRQKQELTVQVTIDIPDVLRAAMEREGTTDLARAVLEALTIDTYRAGKLTAGQVAQCLGLRTSVDALEWLGRRGVEMNYSLQDLEDDRRTLERLFSERRAAAAGGAR
jgi:predicted HTH domain antitoxin